MIKNTAQITPIADSIAFESEACAVTRLKCGELLALCCKLLGEYNSKKILKIDQHLPEL